MTSKRRSRFAAAAAIATLVVVASIITPTAFGNALHLRTKEAGLRSVHQASALHGLGPPHGRFRDRGAWQGVARFAESSSPSKPPPPSPERLMTALGRELWMVADYILEASACFADLGGARPPGAKRTESAPALGNGGIALRNAADMLMEGDWESVMGELETAAAACDGWMCEESFEGIVNLFAYVEPVPTCEWMNAQRCLLNMSQVFSTTADRLRTAKGAPPCSVKAADSLASSAKTLARAARLFDPATFYMPRDPRSTERQSWGNVADVQLPMEDDFESLRQASYAEAVKDISVTADREVAAASSELLRLVDSELRAAEVARTSSTVEGSQDERRSLLQRFVRDLHPDSNAGKEAEVLPIFRYVQRLRQGTNSRRRE